MADPSPGVAADAPDLTALEEIDRLRREHGKPGMTAGEFAKFLPEHLRSPYWRTKIEEWFRQQGIDPDEEGTT